jgi:hypothetical protein
MKKHSTIIPAIFFMLAGLALGAQAGAKGLPESKGPAWKGRMVFSAGINLPSLCFSDNFTDFEQKNRPALLVSMALLLRISDQFGFSAGARLEKRNAAIAIPEVDGGMAATYKTSIMAFPLALVVKPFSRNAAPFFQAGVDVNWLFLNRLVTEDAVDLYQDLLPESRKIYLSPFFGAGYVFALKRGSLVLQACLNLQGAKFYKEIEAGEEYSLRSSSLFVSIGYAIRAF